MADKKERVEIVAVGRGASDDIQGKVALCAYLANSPATDAYNMGERTEDMSDEEAKAEEALQYFDPRKETLVGTVLNRIERTVNTLLEGGFEGVFNIHTFRQGIVIKHYEMASALSEAHKNGVTPEEFDIEPFCKEWYTDAMRNNVRTIARIVLNVLAQEGCSVHFSDCALIPYIELKVPKGLDIPNGMVLDFKDGMAKVEDEEGLQYDIEVRNWPTFARDNAKVIKMNFSNDKYSTYVLERSLRKGTKAGEGDKRTKLEQLYDALWKKCPEQGKATATQKGSLKGLVRKVAKTA